VTINTLDNPEASKQGTTQEVRTWQRVWGADVIALHDSVWCSRGVQVVRPGGHVEKRGPVLYLLLREQQLVDFDLDRVIKQLHWLNPRLLRVRVVSRSSGRFDERIRADEDGRFESVDRAYGEKTFALAQAWLTGEAVLAKRWAAAESGQAAHTEFRKARRSLECAPTDAAGFTYEGSDIQQAENWLRHAMRTWAKPPSIFPGVYEYSPGVWVHETATIEPGAKLIAPAWVGREAHVPSDAVLVGPVILRDAVLWERGVPKINWEEVKSAYWNLKPLGSGIGLRRLIKRCFDIVFSLVVIACTLPLYPLLMLLIFIEDGWPFFFAHKRQTVGGREFPCIKFRTMCRDAEQKKRELAEENASDGPQFHMKHDPRVLKVGRYLRATHLDELPQFWNVLFGHMSVVGPRPSPDAENQFCPMWREARLSVRPGITGLWQIKRTREPETDFQEWIRYDLEYVQHQSFARDLWIILCTVKHMFDR